MRVTYSSDGQVTFESALVTLRGVRPVVNSTLLDGAPEVLENTPRQIRLRYPIPNGGDFGIEINRDQLWLRYWVEGLADPIPLTDFGLRFEALENLRAYLRNGYTSWDGTYYVEPEGLHDFEPYETRPETGYAMTQLLPRTGSGSVVLGFDRHERFQQTFTFDTARTPVSLTILTLWDRKDRAGLNRCESERLVLFERHDSDHEEALRDWARLVADSAAIRPRTEVPAITGWCSWYNLYAYINESIILNHLRGTAEVAKREGLPMRVFQIDDGFTPEMGDWLDVKPQFPRGMKPLLDDIRAAGFVPGLWIGPFMVGNRSRLYREHPDWVVRDRQTGGPLVHWRFYGEFRWHKRSEEYYILDTTHPDAFEYLRRVFHTWRHEWGCEYFKTDFMFWGAHYGPDRAVWYRPGLTRIEIWRRTAEMIREEIGDAIWLGCGCPLWAAVGLVDGIRIGSDVGVEWTGHLSAQSLLRDQATRNFTNRILWQTDPDCILLRERYQHLSEAELRSLAIYAGMTGGLVMTSDDLRDLSPERLKLWKLLLNPEPSLCRFPLLGRSPLFYERLPAPSDPRRVEHQPRPHDPVLVQVSSSSDESCTAVFIFNIGSYPVQRTYPLAALGLSAPLYVYDWTADTPWPHPVERLTVTLAAHDGALLFVSPSPLERAPDRLP